MNIKKQSLNLFLYSHIPFITSSIILIFITFYLVYLNINKYGSYIYPIDDAYIHLSAAKNYAYNYLWGVGKVSSNFSSSPIYTFILYLLTLIFGNNIFYPLILNFSFAVIINYLLNKILSIDNLFIKTLVIVLVNTVGNIYFQTLMGMEHVLHTLMFLIFIFLTTINTNKFSTFKILLTFNIMVLTRFESLFIVASYFIVNLDKIKFKTFALTFFSLISFFIIALIGKFILKGSFIPNSLLIKGNFIDFSSIKSIIYFLQTSLIDRSIMNSSLKFGVFPVFILLILLTSINNNEKVRKISIIWILTCILNSIFGSFGWFYRYEMYIVVSGITLIVININCIKSYFKFKNYFYGSAIIFFIIYSTIPLIYLRGYKFGYKLFFEATNAIYNQHIFLSSFVKKYFNDSTIGVNDIGAISYFSESRIIDFSGLCNNDILNILKKHGWSGYYDYIYEYINDENVDLCLVYKGFVNYHKLKHYVVLGKFVFEKENITGGNEVYLLCRPSERKNLVEKINSDGKFKSKFIETK